MVMIGPRIGAGTEQHSAGHCWSHPEAQIWVHLCASVHRAVGAGDEC